MGRRIFALLVVATVLAFLWRAWMGGSVSVPVGMTVSPSSGEGAVDRSNKVDPPLPKGGQEEREAERRAVAAPVLLRPPQVPARPIADDIAPVDDVAESVATEYRAVGEFLDPDAVDQWDGRDPVVIGETIDADCDDCAETLWEQSLEGAAVEIGELLDADTLTPGVPNPSHPVHIGDPLDAGLPAIYNHDRRGGE